MTKSVSSTDHQGKPLVFPPLSNPLYGNTHKVAGARLKPPLSPPSPLSSRAFTCETSNDEELYLLIFSTHKPASQTQERKKTSPLNIPQVKALMKQAEILSTGPDKSLAFAHFLQAIYQLTSSSILDARGLLVSAFCYMITAKFMKDNDRDFENCLNKAADSLDLLNEKLGDSTCPEKQNCSFMYLLGSAHLATSRHDGGLVQHQKTKNHFLAAARLIEKSPLESSNPLRQKTLLGLSLSYFYETRCQMILTGTQKKRERLLNNLTISREYLEKSLKIYSTDSLAYLHALIRSLIALLLEEEQLNETPIKADQLYRKSEEHLTRAEQILKAVPNKTGDILALLGILQYKGAFDHADIDYYLGCQAVKNLSEAHQALKVLDQSHESLELAIADTHRQIAWVLPLDILQGRAADSLNAATLENNGCPLIAKSNRLVFNLQVALWQLIEASENPVDLSKMRVQAREKIKTNLADLKLLLKKYSKDTYFSCLCDRLNTGVTTLEDNFLHLTIFPDTAEERSKYNGKIQKIGDELDAVYTLTLFKYMLMERLKDFDFSLELELDPL